MSTPDKFTINFNYCSKSNGGPPTPRSNSPILYTPLDRKWFILQGSVRACWKELSKTNIFMCNRLLDDLLVSFYYSMFEFARSCFIGTIILISTADFPLMHDRSISKQLCSISNKNRAFEIGQNRDKLTEIGHYAFREIQ